MGKSEIIRVIYILILIYAIYSLICGHLYRRNNQMLLGLALLFLALILMHYPLSWKHDDYGLY